MLALIRLLSAKVARYVTTQRRLSKFSCGDCDRWQHCGLPPDAVCVARAAQSARSDWPWGWRRRSGPVATDAVGYWYPG